MSVNNVLFSVAEAIPLIGPSIKGALEALYKVLDLIEVSEPYLAYILCTGDTQTAYRLAFGHQTRFQIKEDVEELLQRIEPLVQQLDRTPTLSAPLIHMIRYSWLGGISNIYTNNISP